MTTPAHTATGTPATKRSQRAPMDSMRRTAMVVGVLFVITYITSIAAKFAFYPPFLDNADYLLGDGQDTRVLWGAFFEMLLIIANIGTAVAIYPVLRRRFPVTEPQLRRRAHHGERLHRRRHPGRGHARDHAAGLLGRRRRQLSTRGHQPRPGHPAGVDVQPRPRVRRRRRQRHPARLHDVPHRPGAPRAWRCSDSSAARSSSCLGPPSSSGSSRPAPPHTIWPSSRSSSGSSASAST